MTAQEALLSAKQRLIVYEKQCPYFTEQIEFHKIVILSLDKQIPKKPIKLKAEKDIKIGVGIWKAGTTVYKCPCCNSFISSSSDYCNKCGQALDWSDFND